MITYAGFHSQTHQVQTKDSYILKMHRILSKNLSPNKLPVLFMHGLSSTAGIFLIQGQQKSLPYLLAKEGHDIWLGNNRGNTYSMKHKIYDVDSIKFWDFSFHELGVYDLPAMIDYVLIATNQTKLIFVGHSQGTTQVFTSKYLKQYYYSNSLHSSSF